MSSTVGRISFGALAVLALIASLAVISVRATPAAAAETFVVDTVSDDAALSACTGAAGDCSLRGAISAANVTGTADVIDFDIPSGSCPGGVCRMDLTEGPIAVTQSVTVDGTTQPQNGGSRANVCATPSEPSYMRIELVSSSADADGATVFELNHASGSSTIRGFSFGTDNAVGSTAAVKVLAGSHSIECSHFGLDAAGIDPLGVDAFSSQVSIEGTAVGVTVGTDGDGSNDVGERNVFGEGGNAVYINDNDGNVIAGNLFGIGADGATVVDSGRIYVKQSSSDNLIGSNQDSVSDDIERNYFGSNKSVFIQADTGTGNRVVGNSFGITPDGEAFGVGIAVQMTDVGSANTGLEIRDNTIAASGTGIDVSGSATTASVLISGNILGADNERNGDFGNNTAIALRGSGSHVVAGNDVLNSNNRGIYLLDNVRIDAGSTGNCVVDNKAGLVNDTGSVTVFEDNWWGSADGPSGEGPGSGDTVSTDVDFTPWMTAVPARCNRAPEIADGSLSIAEDAAIGDSVGTVDASDPDGTPLDLSITAGDPSGDFAIGSDGSIEVARSLDFETKPSYGLTVSVSDGLATDTAMMTIEVLDAFEIPVAPSFDDVPLGDTFFVNVEWLAFEGITKGCNPPANDKFCPNAPVTRGQMAAFLHRALADVLNAARPVSFKDIAASVFVADIEWLGSAGVTKGCNPPANDEFCPDEIVTRGQMAAFLVRAFNYTEGSGSDRFTDDDDSVFRDDIDRLAEAGVTLGCNPPANDHFCPDAPVTRAQMSAFLYRALLSQPTG
ncbi:MAG: cadherin domain-containing protein [Acidimicrobiia bacterium]